MKSVSLTFKFKNFLSNLILTQICSIVFLVALASQTMAQYYPYYQYTGPVRNLQAEAEITEQAGSLLKQLLQRTQNLIKYIPDTIPKQGQVYQAPLYQPYPVQYQAPVGESEFYKIFSCIYNYSFI